MLCQVLKQTYQHYQRQYFESDEYRCMHVIGELIEDYKSHKDTEKVRKKMEKMEQIYENKDSNIQKLVEEYHQKNTVSPRITDNEEAKQLLERILAEQELQCFDYSSKKFIHILQKLMDSPFKDDKKFVLDFLVKLTRDKIGECDDLLNGMFYNRIFSIILDKKEKDNELNRHNAFQIMSNMIQSDFHRHKLAENDCFTRVFSRLSSVSDSNDVQDQRILEKLSWLVTLISFHKDMYKHIINLNMLEFILKIVHEKYPSSIRSNAVLAISLLTFNENLFDEILKKGVIDVIMELCRDRNQELMVKQYSTLALVHFALNEKSIQILIQKGVLNLFDTFGKEEDGQVNVVIQTNVSWIFLALCNNGITGEEMLKQGITRDMFLVSCNPEYQQIRHLVITGFAELGRCTDQQTMTKEIETDKQRIKETAIVDMHEHIVSNAQKNIDILLHFSTSEDPMFQYTAFWALKDYVLLNNKNLVSDISDIIQALLNGCLSEDPRSVAVCSNAISFLVTHNLVYQSRLIDGMSEEGKEKLVYKIRHSKVEHILDAVMYTSGNGENIIRTTAFSTLSSLSKYSSQCPSVMAQIMRDIDIPQDQSSKNYLNFVRNRLQEQRELFYQKFKNPAIERDYSGLYSLLRLSQDPCDAEIDAAVEKYIEFISKPYDPKNKKQMENEEYFVNVFTTLKHSKNPKILKKLLKVIKFYINNDESPCQGDIINPHTVLWMLELMESQRQEKYLCCITANILLQIVKKHEIHFDYQEVAIIKKFNLALQYIDVIEGEPSSVEDEEEYQGKEMEDDDIDSVSGTLEERASTIKEESESRIVSERSNMITKRDETKIEDLQELQALKLESNESSSLESRHMNIPNITETKLFTNQPETEKKLFQKEGILRTETMDKKSHLKKKKRKMDASFRKQSLFNVVDAANMTSTSKKLKLFNNSRTKSKIMGWMKSQKMQQPPENLQSNDNYELSSNASVDTEQCENVDIDDINPEDHELVDNHLRDCLIKSFMVIFTNEQSQHLLLNKDLIDITFSCLGLSEEVTLEAKRYLARLISIIFKFPQVQERLMAPEVIKGISDLLNQKKHKEIVRHTIKACTYLSMNYEFIKQPKLSQDVLITMMKLLDQMVNKDDILNVCITVKNILKGDKQNKKYFQDNGGTKKFMDLILKSNDIELIYNCVLGIYEQAYYKKFMVDLLKEAESVEQLKLVIKKCFDLSKNWFIVENTTKTTQKSVDKRQSSQLKSRSKSQNDNVLSDSKFSYSLDESNFQIPEFMKNDLDQLKRDTNQFDFENEDQVNKQGKIRNSAYYIVSRAIKFGLNVDYFIAECDLSQQLLGDIQVQNSYVFQNMLMVMNSLSREAIVDLVGQNYSIIVNIAKHMESPDRKVSLLKVLTNLVLDASDLLAGNQELFSQILGFIIDEEADEKLQEDLLWFLTSLCEQKLFNPNFNIILQTLINNNFCDIISKCLDSNNERTVLQALQLLSKLTDEPEFIEVMFHSAQIFEQIQRISDAQENFNEYKLEIQTTLSLCLDQITKQREDYLVCNHHLDSIKVFNGQLINMALQQSYRVKKLCENEDMEIEDQEIKLIDDDLQRLTDPNMMVENIICTLSNISNDFNFHQQLVQNGVIKVIKKFVDLYQDIGNQLTTLSTRSLNLIKQITFIMTNLSQNPHIHQKCIELNLHDIIKKCIILHDYEIQTNIYTCIGSFICSPIQEIRNKVTCSHFLQTLLEQYESNQFFRIRRICNEYLTNIAARHSELFDLNETVSGQN